MERTGYLTAEEVSAAQFLPMDAPYSICEVSQGFFSVARHYGGMTYNGFHSTYFAERDEAVRDDVLKMAKKMRREAKARASARKAEEAKAKQAGLEY